MAKTFMDKDFLLETAAAQKLYAACENEPVYDYHCHLLPDQIAQNAKSADLAQAWLAADHYKWRMMRAAGIGEDCITGSAGGYDKFLAWARTVENLIGNPLYHWTHLELQRYFDIYEPLTEKSAPAIWEKANTLLQTPELSVKGIFEKQKIYAVGTTDDPIDSLEHHKAIAEGTAPIGKIETRVLPSFRPDKAININAPDFRKYIASLSAASGIKIKKFDDVVSALENRLDFFAALGCCTSDHGLEYAPYTSASKNEIEKIFAKAMSGREITGKEADAYKTRLLVLLSALYSKRNIVMQLHISVIRNVNSKLLRLVGENAGTDAVNDAKTSVKLAALLNAMENETSATGLPKTVLYSLNPKDYYPIATVMGGFQDSGIDGKLAGKMQLGSAWWFCDHRDGMEEQMRVLASLGMLPLFVGMLTDSRSFLSYPRHEYFRRIMCNLIGKWIENGEYPADMPRLEKMVKDISFGNALRYFG